MIIRTGLFGRKALEVTGITLTFMLTHNLFVGCFKVDDEEKEELIEEVDPKFEQELKAFICDISLGLDYSGEVLLLSKFDIIKEEFVKALRTMYLCLEWFPLSAKLFFGDFGSASFASALSKKAKNGEELLELVFKEKYALKTFTPYYVLGVKDKNDLLTKADFGNFADMLDYGHSNIEDAVDPFIQEKRKNVLDRLTELFRVFDSSKDFASLTYLVDFLKDDDWRKLVNSTSLRKTLQERIANVFNEPTFDAADPKILQNGLKELETLYKTEQFAEFEKLFSEVPNDDFLKLKIFSIRYSDGSVL